MTARKTTKKKIVKTAQGGRDARSPAAKKAASLAQAVKRRNERTDGVTVDLICETANGVYQDILKRAKPDLTFPVRSRTSPTPSRRVTSRSAGKRRRGR
jgi:hypothetical protein